MENTIHRFNINLRKYLNPYFWFCFLSLCVLMSYTQLEKLESGGFQYWILIFSAVVFPLFGIKKIFAASLQRSFLVTLFALVSCSWLLFNEDIKAALQLGLFALGVIWVSSAKAQMNASSLAYLYLLFVFIGVVVNLTSHISPYGIFPGYTEADFGRWRVSFFPNVAYTGLFSLILVLVLTRDIDSIKSHPYILVVAIYFLIFSIVRSALIGILVYLLLRWWFFKFGKRMNRLGVFWIILLIAISINIFIAYSPVLIASIQHLPFMSETLLQGKVELSSEEIYNQMYRPWLWGQQINLFLNSPYLMGLGTYEFADMAFVESISQIVSSGSEALLTRMLSVYGLPTILFFIYLALALKRHSDSRDFWACSCFPVVILLMMHWGSVFHPTDVLFILFMFILIQGKAGFTKA